MNKKTNRPTRFATGPIATFVLISTMVMCGDEAVPPPEPSEEADDLQLLYDELRGHSESFAVEQGDWSEDYGDAPFYGLAYFIRAGIQLENDSYRQIADSARDHNLSLIEHAVDDLNWYTDNMEEVFMAGLGLIEYIAATGETDYLEELDAYLDSTDQLVLTLGNYLDIEFGQFAATTYGPTAITGGLALMLLQYATYLDTDRRQARIDRAIEIVEAIDANALDGDRYLFRPDEDKLYLYPNAIMIAVLVRLFEVTQEQAYLERAEGVVEAIRSLHSDEIGYYHSPYSAEYMGAQTADYATLSSQNYLALALILLYENSQNTAYLDIVDELFDFIRVRLYDELQGHILHHWMDGAIAQPGDVEYFCSGCNLQFLYVVWYLIEMVE